MNLRKIDKLVREHVMGVSLKVFTEDFENQLRLYAPRTYVASAGTVEDLYHIACPHYSEDIKEAWAVFEKLGGGGICDKAVRRIDSQVHAEYRCIIDEQDGRWEANAHTAPLAICLAALKAMGVEVPE
jgi:hypothetical protein